MDTPDLFWLTVLIQVQTVFILVGVVIFMTIPKPGRHEFKYLGAYLIVALFNEVTASVGYHLLHTQMNLVLNITDFFYFSLIIFLYKERIHWKNVNAIAFSIIVAYFLFSITNLLFIQGIQVLNTYTFSVSTVCIILISLTYFYVLIQQLPTESITKLPMFWINSAILIYHSGTFFVYLTADYLAHVLNNNLVAASYLLYSLGLVYYSILWYALLLIRAEHRKKQLT